MRRDLIDLAVAVLGRAPSEDELFAWYSSGEGFGAVAASLLASPEAQARFDYQGDDAALLSSAYAALFGREPDAVGLDYWLMQLNSGALSRDVLVPTLLAGARAPTGDTVDAALIDQRLEVATNYLSGVESGSQQFDSQVAGQLVAQVTRESVAEQPPEQTPEPGTGIAIQLEKGGLVTQLDKQSVTADGVASVVISEQEVDAFDMAWGQLAASATQNFGTVLTFTTGSDVLELVTIDFVGASPLRDYAESVGYYEFIDFATFNGELVTAETVGVSEDTFFNGETELFEYFGYDWPWVTHGPEVISRSDGEDFTFKAELFGSLGVANLVEVLDAIA